MFKIRENVVNPGKCRKSRKMFVENNEKFRKCRKMSNILKNAKIRENVDHPDKSRKSRKMTIQIRRIFENPEKYSKILKKCRN